MDTKKLQDVAQLTIKRNKDFPYRFFSMEEKVEIEILAVGIMELLQETYRLNKALEHEKECRLQTLDIKHMVQGKYGEFIKGVDTFLRKLQDRDIKGNVTHKLTIEPGDLIDLQFVAANAKAHPKALRT